MNQNELMSQKSKKVYRVLTYIEHLLILIFMLLLLYSLNLIYNTVDGFPFLLLLL